MTALIATLKVIHILTAVLMAWPFYALVASNQRVRLGPPVGDRTDTFMENIIRNRTIPCLIFQATALVTGIALIALSENGIGALIEAPVLGLKFILLWLIAGIFAYVHLRLQPKIDALFANASETMPSELASQVRILRGQRKRYASVCLFVVLVESMLGVQAWVPFPLWLTTLWLVAIGLFTWRAYRTVIPYGWV